MKQWKKVMKGKLNNMERKFVVRFNKSNESCIMIDQVILIKLLIYFKENSLYSIFIFIFVREIWKEILNDVVQFQRNEVFHIFCSCCEFSEDFYSTCDLYETNDKQLLQKWWSVVIYRHKLLLINCDFRWPIKLSI